MKLRLMLAGAAIATSAIAFAAPVLAPPAQLASELQQYVRVPAGRVALSHVRLIDGTGAAPVEDQTILLDGPSIVAVQSAHTAVPAA
jgi:hypothetical protein